MALDRFQQAILWLGDLKAQVNALERQLTLINNNYKNTINIAQNKNFMHDYIDELNKRYNQRNKEISNVIFILDNFKKEIKKQIEIIENLKKNAKT